MVKRCWVVNATPTDSYSLFFCAEVAYFKPQQRGVTVIADGVDLFDGDWIYSNSTLVDGGGKIPTPAYPNKVFGSCSQCFASTYDCLNGLCIASNTYNTPGLYKSLADCQAVCANGGACGSGKQCVDPTTFCPNGKVCIDQDEYSNIQGLIAKINSEVC